MKRFLLVAALSALCIGCGAPEETAEVPSGSGDAVTPAASSDNYCGTCGQIAGSETCCAEGAEVCEGCGLHKGAPLCCKLDESFTGEVLCGHCGQVGGSELCCAEGAEVCAGCGLHKGAPLCCKLTSDEGDSETETPAETPSDE